MSTLVGSDVRPPATDLFTTIGAQPPDNALRLVSNYAQLIAWHDHRADFMMSHAQGTLVHTAMDEFTLQWPLARPELIAHYVRVYQHTRRALREA